MPSYLFLLRNEGQPMSRREIKFTLASPVQGEVTRRAVAEGLYLLLSLQKNNPSVFCFAKSSSPCTGEPYIAFPTQKEDLPWQILFRFYVR